MKWDFSQIDPFAYSFSGRIRQAQAIKTLFRAIGNLILSPAIGTLEKRHFKIGFKFKSKLGINDGAKVETKEYPKKSFEEWEKEKQAKDQEELYEKEIDKQEEGVKGQKLDGSEAPSINKELL